jgi:hypothetical protein
MRRLRAGLVTPLPGGLGSPSGPTKGDCLQWLDAARTKAGESPPDRVEPKAARVRARKIRSRGQKSPRGAPRGARILQKRMRQRKDLVRRLALHSLACCGGEKCPAQAGKEYGAPAPERTGAMTHVCFPLPKGEGGSREAVAQREPGEGLRFLVRLQPLTRLAHKSSLGTLSLWERE